MMDDISIINEFKRIISVESQAVSSLSTSVDGEVFCTLVQTIAECRGRVLLSGCGTSAQAAKKIAHSLCCIERPASFLAPSDSVHGGLGFLQKDDIIILISKGGNTEELVKMIPACKKKGATLVSVTENENSVIAKEADIFVKVKIQREPDEFNMLATASTMAVIAVFDAVCITLMKYMGYKREQFAIIHPSGAVGDRLLGGLK